MSSSSFSYNMISCFLSGGSFCSGGTAVLLLHAKKEAISSDSIILCWCHGYLSADMRYSIRLWSLLYAMMVFLFEQYIFRWLKLNNDAVKSLIVQKPYSTKNGPAIPSRSNHLPCCLFETSKIALSPTNLTDYGAFVEFDIPNHLPPTFRGLSGVILYYLTLSVQSPSSDTLFYIHFPLHFSGSGVSASNNTPSPFLPKFSNAVAYAVSSVPSETVLSTPQDIYTEIGYRHDDNEVCNVYNVRDVSHICSVILKQQGGSGTNTVFPGDVLRIAADFSENIQPCKRVHVSLLQLEKRSDNSIIQQKTVASTSRYSSSLQLAHTLHMDIELSDDLTCSFSFPLFHVEYQLELEFCLHNKDEIGEGGSSWEWDSSEDKTLSFSIPVTVSPLPAIGCNRPGMNIDSTACRQYLIHQCLERKVGRYPQPEI